MLSGLLLALDLRENGSWMTLIQFGEELNLYEIEFLAHDYLLPGGCPALVEGRAENDASGSWCVRMVRVGAAGCCPALVEGRAEFFWCARFCPCVRAAAAESPWCVLIWCAGCASQNAALPSRRAGQCFQK